MPESAFLLVPTDEPSQSADWSRLDRGARLQRVLHQRETLGALIRERLKDVEVEFLGGVGAWTVRTNGLTDRQSIVDKLQGLPVSVAPDDKFFAG